MCTISSDQNQLKRFRKTATPPDGIILFIFPPPVEYAERPKCRDEVECEISEERSFHQMERPEQTDGASHHCRDEHSGPEEFAKNQFRTVIAHSRQGRENVRGTVAKRQNCHTSNVVG